MQHPVPEILGNTAEHFERHRREVPGLSRLVEQLSIQGFPLPCQDSDETVDRVAQWLDLDTDEARRRLSAGGDEIKALTNELSDRHLLSEVMIRNRKAVVGGFVQRFAYRWAVELTLEEREALQAVENYVQYGFQLADGANNNAIGFVMVTFQKLMASSIAAIRESLGKRRQKIRDGIASQQSDEEMESRLDDDDNVSDIVESAGGVSHLVNEELSLLNHAIEALERVQNDSKSRVLVEQLAELFREHPDEKVLVFTQFRETQRHLGNLVANASWGVNLFHGQMNAEDKDRAVERFRNESGPQVLICTESGGEGRNFQFCHLLVNYDLPWNPMRVEQRIGRVDRIGQEHPIRIFNLWVKGTIEARVLDVLENRIRLFEETVGGLDAILGETESDIQKIMRIAGEERERALEELGNDLERHVREAQDAEQRLGDFIMDTKSYQRELAERIAGQPSPVNGDDFENFIRQLLNSVRTYIKQSRDVYDLTFHSSLIPDNLIKIEPLANQAAATQWEAFQQEAQSQATERVNREVMRLKAYFGYREIVAKDKVEATKATLDRLRGIDDESQRQILPVWEANLRRDEELPGKLSEERHRRIAEAEKFRHPQVIWALKSLGRIEIAIPNLDPNPNTLAA